MHCTSALELKSSASVYAYSSFDRLVAGNINYASDVLGKDNIAVIGNCLGLEDVVLGQVSGSGTGCK